ncbi:RelA/SpoT family protein [Fructilactobacillus fructivorans]|uniref:GTP diphosphokinase n=1 Tax=Fructilactobacillus fructivorans TaxID=1614 RepID=A0AAE6TWW5_9LACO|nr:bifunctional (p)ppGpp synthetase/guanosine-3',5'-bis(diphosphate) 3'-pyrophosphohydrolase [Fructilactobacillus fructivorans]KRK58712.1 (p)ppGpp synthetase I SpoT RelA [Fructilactobacillus fructivorans]QFX92713.1 RelA/SpoT family protein [Fructilactobacillus fructivorans]RDV65695.1 bifunctional (p)ppGpp synthetase/guanosine-3',5'-bis(diphosphate) 3'-pyrophosphohydrolase [Fructilactobacillus fructivorans]
MSKVKEWTPKEIFDEASEYLDKNDIQMIKKAYKFAKIAHEDQKRASGQPYINHPVEVAGILTDLHMDAETITAGFLHDVVEDTGATIGDITELFGDHVSLIVDGVSKLSKIKYKSSKEQLAENHRKLLLAMCKDIRVMIVKLADRLHNMETLDALRPDKQKRIAQETLDIYAPLADRLGIGTIKWELEDLSLRYLKPDDYYEIVNLMNSKRNERVAYVNRAVKKVQQAIEGLGIKGEVYGRPKHIYSIYRKMHDKHKDFKEIYDLLAVRVIVKSVKDCYAVLGAIHTEWKPFPDRFKDYIAMPKPNMYQSLHTTVVGPEGKPLEIQIRTEEMHRIAEYGVAAHWAYKEGKTDEVESNKSNVQLNLFKKIIEIQEESENASDFMDSVQGDLFSDRVYAFTPSGDVIELPKGSIPIDMAYSIHTDVGNSTTGARVNGKLVPLDYEIKNGDIVDIITSSSSDGPGKNWMSMVKTRRAKHKIKQFFKRSSHDDDINSGKETLEKDIVDSGFDPATILSDDNLTRVINEMHYTSIDNLYAAIGFGDIQPNGVVNRLLEPEKNEIEKKRQEDAERDVLEGHKTISHESEDAEQGKKPEDNIKIEGVDNLLVHISRCCDPVPGDEIEGYITMGNGISVHRANCPNLLQAKTGNNRIINLNWRKVEDNAITYDSDLEIQGYNRSGLLNDILKRVNSATKNLNSVEGKVIHEDLVSIRVSVGVRNVQQLDRIIDSVNAVPDVYEVKRTEG